MKTIKEVVMAVRKTYPDSLIQIFYTYNVYSDDAVTRWWTIYVDCERFQFKSWKKLVRYVEELPEVDTSDDDEKVLEVEK